MLLPYASDRPPRNPPLVVVGVVLVSFVVFGLMALALARPITANRAVVFFANLSLVPNGLRPWQPLTYAFLHGDVFHLSVNMLFLWVFGSSVEDALGWKRFLALFLVAAAVTGLVQAGMAHALPGGQPGSPIVGASGAVSAIVGLFAVRFYRSRIRFLGVPWRVPAVLLLLLVLAGEMGATLWQILQAGREGLGQATAHWAHIGGFLLGMGWAQVSRQYEAGHREYMADDARSALDRGAPLAAVRRWEAVLAAQPDNLEAKAELARAWAAAGDRTEAVMHYRLAVMALLKANRKADAAVRYAEMAASYPDETFPPAEQLALAAALEERGNYAAAKTAFELLARAHPDAPEAERARLRRGVLLLKRLKDPAAAADALAEFLRRHPDSEWRGYAEDLLRSAL